MDRGVWCHARAEQRAHDPVTGPDGNLFVTEERADRVDRVRPDGGVVGQFALLPGASPFAITAGPDGNLWVSEFAHKKLARVTPGGRITPDGAIGITTGPDGHIWFAQFDGHRLGIITLEPPTAVTGGATRSGRIRRR